MKKDEFPSQAGKHQVWPPEIRKPTSQLDRARVAVKLNEETARLTREAKLSLSLAFISLGAFVLMYITMALCSNGNNTSFLGQAIMGVLMCLISPITGIIAVFLGIKSWKMPQAKFAIFICSVVGLFYGGCWVLYTFFRK